MPPKSNVPIRICGSKTRSGCKTCKRRHVKCDERQPICLRCEKGNRQCFYDRSHISPLDREAASTLAVADELLKNFELSKVAHNISPYGTHDVVEVTAVKHFTANLGKELAGSFSDDVWCRILPRVAQHEPSIWEAIVALSSLDYSTRRLSHSSHVGNADVSIAVRHYGEAMRGLNARLASTSNACCKDVVLLSCILFAVFETLQNRFDSALRHITGGMKLLTEWTYEAQINGQDSSGTYLDYSTLQPIFLSLDSQAVQMGAAGFREYCSLPALNDQLRSPASFATVNEAYFVLNQIFNRLGRWEAWVEPQACSGVNPGEEWMAMEQQILKTHLAQWDSAFELPLQLYRQQPATVLLMVQRKVIEIIFEYHVNCRPSELEWDQFLPKFEEAVEYAEEYMRLTAGEVQARTIHSDNSRNPRPTFTIAMDIVMPLFYITSKCRDPTVRRRALVILKTCGRKEGIWDSYLSARVAEKIIELEEKAAMEDGHIPESARICGIDVRLDDEGGEVGYNTAVQNADGSSTTQTYQEIASS